jgi:hypothetical protein
MARFIVLVSFLPLVECSGWTVPNLPRVRTCDGVTIMRRQHVYRVELWRTAGTSTACASRPQPAQRQRVPGRKEHEHGFGKNQADPQPSQEPS